MGNITILRGSLCFYQLTEEGEEISSRIWHASQEMPFVESQAWHRVEALTEDLEWYLEFYCRPEDYFVKKYNSGAVHSEVLEAFENIQVQTVLDLGCGQGGAIVSILPNKICKSQPWIKMSCPWSC